MCLNLQKDPWFQKLMENKVATDTANNSAMMKMMLQFYLGKAGLSELFPQIENMLSYGCWCQIFKDRLILNMRFSETYH